MTVPCLVETSDTQQQSIAWTIHYNIVLHIYSIESKQNTYSICLSNNNKIYIVLDSLLTIPIYCIGWPNKTIFYTLSTFVGASSSITVQPSMLALSIFPVYFPCCCPCFCCPSSLLESVIVKTLPFLDVVIKIEATQMPHCFL